MVAFFINKKKFIDKNLEKMDLIIDLQSKLRNTMILKRIPHTHFFSSTYNFKFCSEKKEYSSKDYLENLSFFFNQNIKKITFDLNNLLEKFKLEAKRLLPDKNYIGFSLTQGNLYRKKGWSINNFITLANKVAEKNKIPVFFIEKNKNDLVDQIKLNVPNALFPEFHSSIACPALVTALTSRLDLAVTIDNGVMHMMSLANIPMIALFGPTNSSKFKPLGDDVLVLDSKEMYKSKDINKITVHDVFKLI